MPDHRRWFGDHCDSHMHGVLVELADSGDRAWLDPRSARVDRWLRFDCDESFLSRRYHVRDGYGWFCLGECGTDQLTMTVLDKALPLSPTTLVGIRPAVRIRSLLSWKIEVEATAAWSVVMPPVPQLSASGLGQAYVA
jgi:hypothetical protein